MISLKYCKIDMIRAKSMWWFCLLFPLLSLIIYRSDDFQSMPMGSIVYSLFGALIFATIPMRTEQAYESGFIEMLPGKRGMQSAGHFWFGLFSCFFFYILALIFLSLAHLVIPTMFVGQESKEVGGVHLLILSCVLLFIGLECFFLSIFRFKSLQVMAIISMVPGFLFFFGSNYIMENHRDFLGILIKNVQGISPVLIFVFSLLFYGFLAKLCVWIIKKRG